MIRHRAAWPDDEPIALDSRRAELQAIASDASASDDAREAARHDLFLEFSMV
jgi:hypothetical protein